MGMFPKCVVVSHTPEFVGRTFADVPTPQHKGP